MLGITNFDVINKVSGAATEDNIVRLRCITPGLSRLIMLRRLRRPNIQDIFSARVAYIRAAARIRSSRVRPKGEGGIKGTFENRMRASRTSNIWVN